MDFFFRPPPPPPLRAQEILNTYITPYITVAQNELEIILRDQRVEMLKDVLLIWCCLYLILVSIEFLWKYGPFGIVKLIKNAVFKAGFNLVRRLPGARGVIDRELKKVVQDIEEKVVSKDRHLSKQTNLPLHGWTNDQIKAAIQRFQSLDQVEWRKGKVSGTVYHGGKELSSVLSEVYAEFSHTNPLHPDVFPSIRRMEAEVISMCLRLFHGNPETSCGSMTSGGTESILMACKTYRDRARSLHGVTEPEMVVPVTAHPAFDKAAAYFGIKIIHAPIDSNCRVNVSTLARMITSNTVMIVGSYPAYPHGAFDDIGALAEVARKKSIGLHVDCCLGSFIVPFMEKAGFACPAFDFQVKGVTSISCDTHKFGFAPKGSSVIMYANKELRQFQYCVAPNWPGGIYASPSVAGSRPGALIASCWATLMKIGEDGYIESAKKVITAARQLADGISSIENLRLCCSPDAMVVAWTSETLNIYAISDEMTKRGWNLNALQNPPAVHVCVTLPVSTAIPQLLSDLKESVAAVVVDPAAKKDGMGAIYGMAASIPDKSLVCDITKSYLDALTKL